MRIVKLSLMAVEMAMMIGIVLLSFLTDWSYLEETGDAWTIHLLIVLMTVCAVILQREQQNIKINEDGDSCKLQ